MLYNARLVIYLSNKYLLSNNVSATTLLEYEFKVMNNIYRESYVQPIDIVFNPFMMYHQHQKPVDILL